TAVQTAAIPSIQVRAFGREALRPVLQSLAGRYTGNGCFLSLRAGSQAPTKSLILNGGNRPHLGMTLSVQISRGIESLFGTRDENIRVLEQGLNVQTRLMADSLEIEGEEPNVIRAASILEDYFALIKEGQSFQDGDLNSYLRVVTQDPEVTLRSLVHSGRQRNFGKKVLAPKTVNQRRYVEAIE